MDRKTKAGFALFALLVATSGCLDLVTGGTASFESSEATVSSSALEESGYAHANSTTQQLNETFEVAGQERSVSVTNHITQYERSASLGPVGERDVARFVVMTTPAVEIAGQTLNPVGSWSERQIVERLSTQYSGLEDVEHVDNRSVRSLGESRTVEEFSGRATIAGDQQIDVAIHVTKFEHGDDFVVGVGIHPEQLSGERDRVDTMFGGLEH